MDHKNIQVDESAFPRYGTRGEKLTFLLRYAALAYSPFNTQPWQFRVKQDTAEIHIAPDRQLTVRDPDSQQLLLSCGAVIGNLIVACRYFGYEPNINLLTGQLNSTLVATVALGALVDSNSEYALWFEQITKLESGLVPFRKGPLPSTLFPVISRISRNYRVRVKNIQKDEKALFKITTTAVEREQTDVAYREEFSTWLRSQKNEIQDGLTANYFGIGTLGKMLGKRWLIRFTSGSGLLKNYKQLFNLSAGGFIINTDNNNPDLILESGIVLQQSLLAIRSQGLLPVICEPPLDLSQVRQDIGTRFCEGRSPQAIILYGWAKKQGVILPTRQFQHLFETTEQSD